LARPVFCSITTRIESIAMRSTLFVAIESWLAKLYAPFALATRVYVGWVFLKAGLLKIQNWDSTLSLFAAEYRVPLLPPYAAAVLGTAAELVLPVLLMVGLFGRTSALAMSLLNAFAVISYAHVLLAEGFEAAIAQHYLWGFMLLMLTIAGLGSWTLERAFHREAIVLSRTPI
jgi:putative oxidoreductase